MTKKKKETINSKKYVSCEYSNIENSTIKKTSNIRFDLQIPNENDNLYELNEDYFKSSQLFYVDLSTSDKKNNYVFYEDFNDIPEEYRTNVSVLDLSNRDSIVYKYIPEEIKNENVFRSDTLVQRNNFLRSVDIKQILGLQQSYNFHIKEGVKLTETLNQGVITISKVSGTVGKVFTVLGTLGGYASAAGSAFSAAKSLLGLFIPELKEPSIGDVLNKLEEMRAEFKAAIEQLKSEIKLLLKEAFASDYITKTKLFIEASAQLSESYFNTYIDLIKHEGTVKFDEKSLISHLYGNQNSYFNFLFKQLTDPASTDAIYNAIKIIVDKNYVKHTILSKPNEKYDATKVYTDNGPEWNGGASVISTLDYSIPDYFSDTNGYDGAYVLKASTKVFANLIETFLIISQDLLNYYVSRELIDVRNPVYNQLRPQIETALREIDKRLATIIATWQEYLNQSIYENEAYALRVWRNIFYAAATKAKCVTLTHKVGYPGTHKDLISGIGQRYNNSKFWKTDSIGYPTYEFAIRNDYSDYSHNFGDSSIVSHSSLWSLQQGLYIGWGKQGWGLAPRGRNSWTYNYLTELHEIRPKIARMVWFEDHKNHIKNLLDFDSTIDSLNRLRTSINNTLAVWFQDKEHYPLLRRQNIDICEFSKNININRFNYVQPKTFPSSIKIQKNEYASNSTLIISNKVTFGFKYANALGLSKQNIVWNNQDETAPDTGTYLNFIPKYDLQNLQISQAIPAAEVYMKFNNNIYLVNKVDYQNNKCNLTGIEPLENLMANHPLFSSNKDLANSAIASYPSILRSISKDINYSRLEFDFGNWSNVIRANYVTNRSLNLSVGIRPLFKDENSINLFGDIVWIYRKDDNYNHLGPNGIYYKFNLKGLPPMNFTKPSSLPNNDFNLRVCGFQIVYSYYIHDKAPNTTKFTITSSLEHRIYVSGTGIAYECIDKSYNGSPIEVILGKTIWIS